MDPIGQRNKTKQLVVAHDVVMKEENGRRDSVES